MLEQPKKKKKEKKKKTKKTTPKWGLSLCTEQKLRVEWNQGNIEKKEKKKKKKKRSNQEIYWFLFRKFSLYCYNANLLYLNWLSVHFIVI